MRTLPNLPATIAREAYASLCGVLPPPAIDTPETRAARDDEAMAAVAILRPADAFEARLAVDVVTAEAHARDCLRLAAKYCNDVTTALRCRAQFAVMMRQMQSALRTLQRMQAARQDTDAASAPGDDQRPQPTSPRPDERQAIPDPAVPDRRSATRPAEGGRRLCRAAPAPCRPRPRRRRAAAGNHGRARPDDRPRHRRRPGQRHQPDPERARPDRARISAGGLMRSVSRHATLSRNSFQ